MSPLLLIPRSRALLRMGACCLGLLCWAGTARAATVPYATDFEAGIGAEWSSAALENGVPDPFTRFTGRFANDTQTLTLEGLEVGVSYSVLFDLYVLDSWDGNGHQDRFMLEVDGVEVFNHTFHHSNINSQTYPEAPDVGPAALGFSGWTDSIYRSIEVSFNAAATTAVLSFRGANLQGINDESWGLDNVIVNRTSALGVTRVVGTSLPEGAAALAIQDFSLLMSRNHDATAAAEGASYELVHAGENGLLGDGDDRVVDMAPVVTGPKAVRFAVAAPPLGLGSYRFRTSANLTDVNGNEVEAFEQLFEVVDPVSGIIEGQENGVLQQANALPMFESPASSGLFTSYIAGGFSGAGDVDFYRFEAAAEDRVSIRLEADGSPHPSLILQNAAGQNISSTSSSQSVVVLENVAIPSSGDFYIRVATDRQRANYALRIDQARGPQLEAEDNGDAARANALVWRTTPGVFQGEFAGALPAGDGADWISLGTINAGNQLRVTVRTPDGSSLAAEDFAVELIRDDVGEAVASAGGGLLDETVEQSGVHYLRVTAGSAGLRAQYLLEVVMTDAAPPVVEQISLPAEGGVTSGLIDRFSIWFSEPIESDFLRTGLVVIPWQGSFYLATSGQMNWQQAQSEALNLGGNLVTINSSAENDFVRQTFGSAYGELWIGLSDQVEEGTFVWASGEEASYRNWNGGEPNNSNNEDFAEMQSHGRWNDVGVQNQYGVIEIPGPDTDGDGIPDLMDPFPDDALNVFALAGAGADSLFETDDDRIYHLLYPGYNGALRLDLVVVDGPLVPDRYRLRVSTNLEDRAGNSMASDLIREFTVEGLPGFAFETAGNGSVSTASAMAEPGAAQDGTLTPVFYGVAGTTPYFVSVADFDSDGLEDIAVAAINGNDVAVWRNAGDLDFESLGRFAAGNGPISSVAADLNGDGHVDLAFSNWNGHTVSVLLGDGTGQFAPAVSYGSGTSPRSVAAGDFDGDGDVDLATSNTGSGTVSVFLNHGDGSFASAVNLPGGNGPHSIQVLDVSGDGHLDLATANANSDDVSVYLGVGDGTFAEQVRFPAGDGPRSIVFSDLNNDGEADIATLNANAQTVSVLFGNGDGTFQIPAHYSGGLNNPYHIVVGEFDGQSGMDLAVANYGRSRVNLFYNNGSGSFETYREFEVTGNPIGVATADLDGDGVSEVISANHNGGFAVLRQNADLAVSQDPDGSGMRRFLARGRITDRSDHDFWSFTGRAGDRLVVAAETPEVRSGSQLYIEVMYPDGNRLLDFHSAGDGIGQSAPTVLPASGRYYVRVRYSHDFFQEYQLRVTLVPAPIQLESEDNNVPGRADGVSFALNGQTETATMAGYVAFNDDAGDYYALGNLAVGSTVELGVRQPSTSKLAARLQLVRADGLMLSESAPGDNALTYALNEGEEGFYYVRILAGLPGLNESGVGLLFNGTSDHVDLGGWSPGTHWTIEAWVLPTSVPGGRRTVAGGFAECRDWGIGLNGTAFSTSIRPPSGCSATVSSGLAPTARAWYHLVGTCDGAEAKVYVNGQLLQSGPVDPNYVGTTAGTRIGGEACCSNNGFPGVIQDVRIWDRPLTAGEVASVMASGPDAPESGVAGYWRLAEGSGETANDTSAQGRVGTLAGPKWVALGPADADGGSLLAEYLLDIGITDLAAPEIVSDSLPEEGSENDFIFDRFDLGFSEDMLAASVNDSNTFELQNAGADGSFGSADDEFYTVTSTGYSAGLMGTFMITDGPLQPGAYRFRVGAELKDRGGNGLAAPYVRLFSISGVDGFVLENRLNGSLAEATSLSVVVNTRPSGALVPGGTFSTGANPYHSAAADLDQDGHLDAVIANYNGDSLSLLMGDGTGALAEVAELPSGRGTISVAIGDLNGDGWLDLASVNHAANTAAVFMSDGAGGFLERVIYNTAVNPRSIAMGDLDEDGHLDLVVANESGDSISFFKGNGDGTVADRVDTASGDGCHGVVLADLDGDGHLDAATANAREHTVSVLLGNGDGTFEAPLKLPVGTTPRSIDAGDLNGDGRLDLVTVNAGDNQISVLLRQEDGTYVEAGRYGTNGSNPYCVLLADLDLDGDLDVAVASNGSSSVNVLLNAGDGRFEAPARYQQGSGAIWAAAGDFNEDGMPDLVVANHSSGDASLWLGVQEELLAADGQVELWNGWGRGNSSENGDHDYWSFSGEAGDRLVVALETLGTPGSSQMYMRVDRPDGDRLVDSHTAGAGWGETGPVTLPLTGRYVVRVRRNHNYAGEYRLRVTLAKAPLQLEGEPNNQISQADVPSLVLSEGRQRGTVLGYISAGDGSGDYYGLGNLADGTQIRLTVRQPERSALVPMLSIYNRDGQEVASGAAGEMELIYDVLAGAEGTYTARVRADSGAGLDAQYLLDIDLADTVPPAVVSDTLPEEGSENIVFFERFQLVFSEDMEASTVNDSASYDLRAAGPDGEFGSEDDSIYQVQSSGYSSGVSVSYFIPDGPLQPGTYRFTARVTLLDRAGNGMAAPFVRHFSIAGVDGYVMESRENGSAATADSLSVVVNTEPSGSFQSGGLFATGRNPYHVSAGDLNSDGALDVVVANYNGASVSVLLGDGTGDFSGQVEYASGNGTIATALGDVNGDGVPDVVAVNHSANNLSVFLGNGDGTLQEAVRYGVGSRPRSVALGDMNGDGHLDVMTANESGDSTSYLQGIGDGTFAAAVDREVGDGAHGVVLADFDGDGALDVAVVNAGSHTLSIMLGNGDGTAGAPAVYGTGGVPRSLGAGDFNGDGLLDVAVLSANENRVGVFLQQEDGTFEEHGRFATDGSNPYGLTVTDIDGDGDLDLVASNNSSNSISVLQNLGNATFSEAARYSQGNGAIWNAAGDFNEDGVPDLVVANHNSSNVALWLGSLEELLAQDSQLALWNGWGRGNSFDSNDGDYWSFSGEIGDRLVVALETLGSPNNSQMYLRVDRPDGQRLVDAYTAGNGSGQSPAVTLPMDGRYTVWVRRSHTYSGEYRLRVTLAKAPVQLENEGNGSFDAANGVRFVGSQGELAATLLGYISTGDVGDYYNLGSLGEDSRIELGLVQPDRSGLVAIMALYDRDNQEVAVSAPGEQSLIFEVPADGEGRYTARLHADAGAGLDAQYLLDVTVADGLGPRVVSDTLPAQGSAQALIVDRFSLGFSEDLLPVTANASSSYDLRAAGGDGLFGTGDDETYEVVSSGYGGGLAASYTVSGGPLQPGEYRFRAKTSLLDRASNPLASEYVREFTILAVDGYQLESRSNDSRQTADSLAGEGLEEPAGSFLMTTTLPVGSRPHDVLIGDFNGDGHHDFATANYNGGSVTVYLGRGDGTFGERRDYPAGNGVLGLAWEEVTGDGVRDLVVVKHAVDAVGVLPGNADGSFGAATTVSVGDAPYGVQVGDFNEDGVLDLIVSNENSDNLSYLQGNGDGTFAPAVASVIGDRPFEVAIGDFNEDGHLDLAVALFNPNQVAVVLGDGTGSFSEPTLIAVGANPRGVVSGDLDGDGHLDLVVVGASSNDAAVLIGDGNGSFAEKGRFATDGSNNHHVALADLNGDGALDLLVPNYGQSTLSILLNRGDGSLETPSRYNLPNNTISARSADFNGDGIEDVIASNYHADSATILFGDRLEPLTEDPAGSGIFIGQGRGNMFSTGDWDYWSFTARAGDRLHIAVDNPRAPGSSQLYYRLDGPDGLKYADFHSDGRGLGEHGPLILNRSGRFTLGVRYSNHYFSEYRFRVTLVRPPMQMEAEENANPGQATALVLGESGNGPAASITGYIRNSGDRDYFGLGTVEAGSSVFVTTRVPQGSDLAPVISVYDAGNGYKVEAGSGRPTDGVAEVQITQTANYFVAIESAGGTGSLNSRYIVDVQILPTGSVSFPNLQVTDVTVPEALDLMSGDEIEFSFEVSNVGSVETASGSWSDRAVLSVNNILGDGDDYPLGIFPHNSLLGPGASYRVDGTGRLPDGIEGLFRILVQTDFGNAINEFVLEGDNVTASEVAFPVALQDYPDLVVENLRVTGPENGEFLIDWSTANRGTKEVAAGFLERVQVRHTASGQTLLNVTEEVAGVLLPGEARARSRTVTTVEPGQYRVTITTDADNRFFEFGPGGHVAAERNAAFTEFGITQFFDVLLSAAPPEGGTVSGGGRVAAGTAVTVEARADDSSKPYRFLNWTDNGVFQSASSNYTFTVFRDRALVANFTLPLFQISASNEPAAGGLVIGTGNYFYGTTNVLTARPNGGYLFTNWTENGIVVSEEIQFTNIVSSNRLLVANYIEANPFHDVTTETLPAGLAEVEGAGVYENGETATFVAPAVVTNEPNIFYFERFTLNGSAVSTNRTFERTFFTADPSNMVFVAEYRAQSLLPQVMEAAGVVSNPVLEAFVVVPNPVPAMDRYQVALRFDRSMDTNVEPVVRLMAQEGQAEPEIAAGGQWASDRTSHDTYRTPLIALSDGMDGVFQVQALGARDLAGAELPETNLFQIVVDVTPPPHPAIAVAGRSEAGVTVAWNDYGAPNDLAGFRIYRENEAFGSVAGLASRTRLEGVERQYLFGDLELDRPYHVAVAAVDVAGNSASSIQSLRIQLESTTPPPVPVTLVPVGPDRVQVDWSQYDASGLIGFSGFHLYIEAEPFVSVDGLVVRETLGPDARTTEAGNLDRSRSYYIAVVGFNRLGGFESAVVPVEWKDPFAGTIEANLRIGGAGERVRVRESIVVEAGAEVRIEPGTILEFESGTGFAVQNGVLLAQGTALQPIIFTSVEDEPDGNPQRGDWGGLKLRAGAGGSVLEHVIVRYGGGLVDGTDGGTGLLTVQSLPEGERGGVVVDSSSPTVRALTVQHSAGAGLVVKNGADISTTEALVVFNEVGLEQLSNGHLNISESVIRNNDLAARAAAEGGLEAGGNWWGSSQEGTIQGQMEGPVTIAGFLNYEPVLTPAIGPLAGETNVGTQTVTFGLASRTAAEMRLSEDSAFSGVFFEPFEREVDFELSEGAGEKTVYAQFRSVTGHTSDPVSVTVNYVTEGPVITEFNLVEGQELNRPLIISGAATAVLGMSTIAFEVDGVEQHSAAGGNYLRRWDIRQFSGGVHRVRLVARDRSGNLATLERNVFLSPTPPPAPAITEPEPDTLVNEPGIVVRGTGEPLLDVRLARNGTVVASGRISSDGTFGFNNVPLVEGRNELVVTGSDAVGSTPSAGRVVQLDSGAPERATLTETIYQPGVGLTLRWQYPETGERPSLFQLFWNPTPFDDPAEAVGQTVGITSLEHLLRGLAGGTYYFGVVGYDGAGNASPLSDLVRYDYDGQRPQFTASYSRPEPVGTGMLRVVLTANEPLQGVPSLTVRPQQGSPLLLNMQPTALNTYEGEVEIRSNTASGTARLIVSATDEAGNVFNGQPENGTFVIDTMPPTGTVSTVPSAPVQVTEATEVLVTLSLSERAEAGSVPELEFQPPQGTAVAIELVGEGTVWSGQLALEPAMGSGNGLFSMRARDEVGNRGTSVSAGRFLEIYNTELPEPPAVPQGLRVESLDGGRVRLTWQASEKAEAYRLYREPGDSGAPAVAILDEVLETSVIDLPPEDGFYRYAVSASRRGAESELSSTRVSRSDRTPPAAPVNVTVQLAASGVQIQWEQPPGDESPDRYFLYRNGNRIRTVRGATSMVDSPPRGVMNYEVAAVDVVGNENRSESASIALLVGAVQNLNVLVNDGMPPVLNWVSGDPTAVSFDIYRNGVKQNLLPIEGNTYTDFLPSGNSVVTYSIRARNAGGDESASRMVDVYPVRLTMAANPDGGSGAQPLLTDYFDQHRVRVANIGNGASLPLEAVEVRRSLQGADPTTQTLGVGQSVAPGNWWEGDLVLPSAKQAAPQMLRVRAIQATDSGGSTVSYQRTIDLSDVRRPGVMAAISANAPPLAGGFSSFEVQFFNRATVPVELVTARDSGGSAGDVYIAVRNAAGQEVSRTEFSGAPGGTQFAEDGSLYLPIAPGGSVRFTVPNVLVPEALGGAEGVTIEVVAAAIHHGIGTEQMVSSGPLRASMSSQLIETPYYGTAGSTQPGYANDEPVVIEGQAIDRETEQPVPNALLKIGVATRGFHWFNEITTDDQGGYRFEFLPPAGLSGALTFWAAHPEVFDQLNQVQVSVYRLFASPAEAEIRMSKNDSLRFSITLINPGDEELSGFSTSFRAYRTVDAEEVEVPELSGQLNIPEGFVLGAGERKRVEMELTAAADAPDDAIGEFRVRSAEGAAFTFQGMVSLLPAVPILSVTDPTIGYLEVSLDRGGLLSRQITVMNRGLKDLEGVTLEPPANLAWMIPNLSASEDGKIHLPDIKIGESISIPVVFAPPEETELGFYEDKLIIRGTNTEATFDVRLFALVTSDLEGSVQFYVESILGLPVPNAKVRLRSSILRKEIEPAATDVDGLVTISGLQEGDWHWQVTAPGHSANAGSVRIIPGQTVRVGPPETRLSKSLVTINFTVEPVPYTDRYEIKIEQTFETHVTAPVLVLDPAYRNFQNVQPGFETSFIVKAKNHGLIKIEEVEITGSELPGGSLTPLIEFIPEILPQQTIEIPFRVVYRGDQEGGQQGRQAGKDPCDPANGIAGGLADCVAGNFIQTACGLMNLNAIAQGGYRCFSDASLIGVAQGLLIGLQFYNAVLSPVNPLVNAFGCLVNYIAGKIFSGGDGGGGKSYPGGGSSGGFSGLGPKCFVAGTEVLMADGTVRRIEDVAVGDRVKTGPKEFEMAEVTQTFTREADDLYRVAFVSRSGGKREQERSVTATGEHLFWVDGKGWIEARRLVEGDWLFGPNGEQYEVVAAVALEKSERVHTFKLREDQAFYANNLLVHDMCGPWTSTPVASGKIRQEEQRPVAAVTH